MAANTRKYQLNAVIDQSESTIPESRVIPLNINGWSLVSKKHSPPKETPEARMWADASPHSVDVFVNETGFPASTLKDFLKCGIIKKKSSFWIRSQI